MLKFDEADSTKMLALQRQIAIVLKRADKDKMEAAVAAFALVRLARELLEKYPAGTQFQLIDLCCAFLRRDEVEQKSPLSIN